MDAAIRQEEIERYAREMIAIAKKSGVHGRRRTGSAPHAAAGPAHGRGAGRNDGGAGPFRRAGNGPGTGGTCHAALP